MQPPRVVDAAHRVDQLREVFEVDFDQVVDRDAEPVLDHRDRQRRPAEGVGGVDLLQPVPGDFDDGVARDRQARRVPAAGADQHDRVRAPGARSFRRRVPCCSSGGGRSPARGCCWPRSADSRPGRARRRRSTGGGVRSKCELSRNSTSDSAIQPTASAEQAQQRRAWAWPSGASRPCRGRRRRAREQTSYGTGRRVRGLAPRGAGSRGARDSGCTAAASRGRRAIGRTLYLRA